MVINALQAVLMVILIMAFGWFAGWRGWAGPGVKAFISKLLLNITMPCLTVMAFLDNLSRAQLASSWRYLLAAFLAIGVVYAAAKLIARAANVKKTQRGVFTTMFAFSNSMYIGLPVATAIFGAPGMIFAVYYYVANTTWMNSAGLVEIERDGMLIAGEGRKSGKRKNILKMIFQPPLAGVMAGVLLVALNARLPEFLSSALRYTGAITSPLALIFVGIILQQTGLSSLKRFDRGIVLTLVGRFVLSPLVMFFVAGWLGLDGFAQSVFVVQMGLPAMVASSIFAEAEGADTEFAARGVAITTLVSFAAIPVYIALLGG